MAFFIHTLQYIGEHIVAGVIGNIMVITMFCFSILSACAYALFYYKKDPAFLTTARIALYTHSIGVMGAVGMLLFMIFNQYFEYHYVWQHSSKSLPMRYIFACFWEGQEGSFLLWIFWNMLLANILRNTSKAWESNVLSVIMVIQAFLSSMLLGVYINDFNIGSNPFTMLLREHADFQNLPLFVNENYLATLDGRGLNPLLQNYWMTIHPPTLFLGFALSAIPFCYAIAALWRKQWKEWINPSLTWIFIGVSVLGIGILMGGAWAYEALSFGGFWAWDPVENASLVPWILLVAGGHTLIIEKNKGGALLSSLILIILSFLLVLYSTFLTRSGILGEASVHSFTDLGLSGQLLLYLLFFLLAALFLLIYRRSQFKQQSTDEAYSSRELWVFIGSMILLVSSIQITFSTSIPVLNKIISWIPIISEKYGKLAPPSNVIEHYHQFQIPLVIILQFILGWSQFLKYQKTNLSSMISKLIYIFLISCMLSFLIQLWLLQDLSAWTSKTQILYFLLFTSTIFNVICNSILIKRSKKSLSNLSGASMAHIGFGLIILGALISQGYQQVISSNSSGVDVSALGKSLNNNENILIYQQDTLPMNPYWVSYQGKKKEGINVLFEVNYFNQIAPGRLEKAFTLFPRVQLNDRMGNVSEPDTKHEFFKDIYSHVTYATWNDLTSSEQGDYIPEPKEYKLHEKDTFFTSNALVWVESIHKAIDPKALGLDETEIAVGLFLNVQDMKGNIHIAKPVFSVNPKTGETRNIAAEVDSLGLKFIFHKIDTQDFSFELNVFEKKKNYKDFIVLKTLIFPGINILWIGCLLMAFGSFWAVIQRLKKQKHRD